MIDNLISDPMKLIWINLELYFESYEFSNFYDFFKNFLNFYEFLMNLFRIFMNLFKFKINFSNLKSIF